MFNSNHSGSQKYNQVPPYSDSDSDDDGGEDDFIQREIKNQQVSSVFFFRLRFICLIEIGANESYATRYNILLYRGNHLHLLSIDWDALYYTSQTFGFNSLHTTTTTFTNAWKYINITPMQMMMKEQDEGLEMLGQSAERLSKISLGIHEELGHQNKWVYRCIWLRFEILENYGKLWSL